MQFKKDFIDLNYYLTGGALLPPKTKAQRRIWIARQGNLIARMLDADDFLRGQIWLQHKSGIGTSRALHDYRMDRNKLRAQINANRMALP